MATNKIESLDPALIRPGRIDRKIEFPLPDIKTKRRIFGIHTVRKRKRRGKQIPKRGRSTCWRSARIFAGRGLEFERKCGERGGDICHLSPVPCSVSL